MKILVTGAYGQLGRELCRQIGPAVVGIDCDSLDLTKGSAIEEALARISPQLVLNCAAYTQVDKAEQEADRCRAINATAVEHIVRACVALGVPLLQVSTDYVFSDDSAPRIPHRETDPVAPQGVYATTKREGELAAAGYSKHWIVRTCGLYARRSHTEANHFVKTMLRLGATRPKLRVVNDQHCTPSYVPHVAAAILNIAGVNRPEPAPWGIYHVVNGGSTTWHDFAAEIFRLAGLKVEVEAITTAEYGAPAARPLYSVLDTTKYHALGVTPMASWNEALAEYFAERG
jgi:dTDP-4-dehydrorhamnose reductase